MADQEQQQFDQQMQSVQQQQQPEMEVHMIACVDALDASLLPCLKELELNKDHDVADFEAPLTDFNESVMEPGQSAAEATELHASDDRPPPPDHHTDVEKHASDFMEAAKKLQQYFISLQREDKPTKAETVKKEIAAMEEESKMKDELIQKQEKVIQEWKEELRGRLDKHNAESERV